jgi:hypothetical protein
MIRELVPPDTGLAFAAKNELRPQLGDQAEFARRVDEVQRPEGYRLVVAFDGCRKQAVAAAGFAWPTV